VAAMSDDLGKLLLQALDDIDEVGGPERHQLVQVIGRDAYEALIAKPKGADVVSRWIDATGKAKAPATKALSIAIARVADKPELVARIEKEVGEAFDDDRAPTDGETKNTPLPSINGATASVQATRRLKAFRFRGWPNSPKPVT
jgi:hypothetical protein